MSDNTIKSEGEVSQIKHYIGIVIEEVDSRFNRFTEAVTCKLDKFELKWDRRFDELQKDLKITQMAVRSNHDEILKNRKAIEENRMAIGENSQRIESLDSKIAGVEQRLSVRIDENKMRIKSLDNKIDGVEQRLSEKIDAIHERLDEHDVEIATLKTHGRPV